MFPAHAMGWTMKHHATLGITLCGLLVATAWADTLVTTSDKVYQGKLISRDGGKVVFEIHKYGAKMSRTFSAREVKSVTVGDDKANGSQDDAANVKNTSGQTGSDTGGKADDKAAGDLPPKPKAPPVVVYRTKTYYVIPLTKMVGKYILARNLEEALADAKKRGRDVAGGEVD